MIPDVDWLKTTLRADTPVPEERESTALIVSMADENKRSDLAVDVHGIKG
jgi:hypothetical protein